MDYLELLDSFELSDDFNIVILPLHPSIIADQENVQENNLHPYIPRDVSGEVQISINMNIAENEKTIRCFQKGEKQ
ncbi:hypothetical protein NPIL_508351, partial [Nephila pilipes]